MMLSPNAVVHIAFVAFHLVVNGAHAQECADPIGAILATLECVQDENATCATAGYDAMNFIKLHNGVDTNTVIDSGDTFWNGAFALTSLEFEFSHQMNIGKNQASVRYIEKVTITDGSSFGLPPRDDYPYGEVIFQHEHALVTVDNDCRMVLWDQYGDDKEQKDVDDAILSIRPRTIFPFWT